MDKPKFCNTDIRRLKVMLSDSRNIVITCHLSPDGDALGSSLGLKCLLRKLNPAARVAVVTPDEPTHTLSFLPGFKEVMPNTRYNDRVKNLLNKADLLICLDFNELSRTDLLAPSLRSCKAYKLHIDHHIAPEDFADLRFSYPDKSATCMLLFELIEEAGLVGFVDKECAECLLAGMMTDTGDFSYNIPDASIYIVIGKLISLGADKARLTRLLFQTFSETNLRIQGYALSQRMEVFYDAHAALVTLSRDELNRFDYKKGDTEGLVNKPLAIPGILYSCYLREETDYIKVSMRSLGDFPVNRICADHFGGGGHKNASGGEFYGTLEECADKFRSLLEVNKEMYINGNTDLAAILAEEKR